MKKIFLFLTLFYSAFLHAQIRPAGHFSSVNFPYNASQVTGTYVSLPTQYASTTTTYPLLVFLHGAGEAGTTLSTIYNSLGSGGFPYYIEHSGFPDSVLNAADGKYYAFIVIAPQRNNGWSSSGDELDYEIKFAVANYRVDINRIYITGPSAGGAGLTEYAGHLDPNEDPPSGTNDHPRAYPAAAISPMSIATITPTALWAQKIVGDTIKAWGFGDQNNDVYGENTWDLTKASGFMNGVKAGSSYFTGNPGDNGSALFTTGHGPWNPFYISTFSSNSITSYVGNLEKWYLQFHRNTPVPLPGASAGAGADQFITLPTTSTSITGTAFAGSGNTVTSTLWSQISGPLSVTFGSASSLTSTVTGMTNIGVYTLKFSVTNSASVTVSDTMTITVSSASYTEPVITTGSNQTITSPTSTASITSSTTYNGSAQSSFSWYPLFKPGQSKVKFAFLGSSTASGAGATTDDSAVVGRFRTWAIANGLCDSVINFAVSGTNMYQAMPNGFTPNGTVHAQLSPSDTPAIASNITAALNRGCNFFIFMYPTNGYDVLSFPNIKIPWQKFADTLSGLGIPYYFCTSQPRGGSPFDNQTAKNQLKLVNDSMKVWFPGHTIDTYTMSVVPGTTTQISTLGAGDSIHYSNLGHYYLFQQISSFPLFSTIAAGGFTITSPTSNNTGLTGLGNGVNIVQAVAYDTHGQAVSSTTKITRNGGSVIANAGSDQTITLPTSSVTVSGSGSTGATSYLWTRVSGPNIPTITTPTTVGTTITGLIQGTYVFQLQINGSSSFTDQMQVVVNPAVAHGCGSNAKYFLTADPVDSSVFVPDGVAAGWLGGDTVVLPAASSEVDFVNVQGAAGCPIIFTNPSNSIAFIQSELSCEDCASFKITGTGMVGTTFGIVGQHDPQLRYQWRRSISIQGKSTKIEIDHYKAHNVDIGIVIEPDESCDTTANYPNWKFDSIYVHDNSITGTWNEGMYIGNTSPDNGQYDLRPVVCNGTTFYYKPAIQGYTRIYNNYVDSTGRGGIQLSNSRDSSEISFNTVKHSGLNGDDAQGAAINWGLYTHPYVHDNTISDTYTWGIASVGGCETNHTMRVESNTIDSSGYLLTYNLATTSRIVYDPRTEPTVPSQILTWPQTIEIDTRPRAYTTDVQPGTAVPGTDSTTFNIRNNSIGIHKNSVAINVENNYGGLQANGNTICNNKNFSGTAATLNVIPGINFSNSCSSLPVFNCKCYLLFNQ